MGNPVTTTAAVLGTAQLITSISAGRKAEHATRLAGLRQKRAGEYEARQFDLAAGQRLATGQYSAADVRRLGEISQSDLIAQVAASGGDPNDPTIALILGRNAAEIEHRAMMELYASEEEARTLRARGEMARLGGVSALGESKAAASAIRMNTMASALGIAGGLTARYWKPPTSQSLPTYMPGGANYSPVTQPFPPNYQPKI